MLTDYIKTFQFQGADHAVEAACHDLKTFQFQGADRVGDAYSDHSRRASFREQMYCTVDANLPPQDVLVLGSTCVAGVDCDHLKTFQLQAANRAVNAD